MTRTKGNQMDYTTFLYAFAIAALHTTSIKMIISGRDLLIACGMVLNSSAIVLMILYVVAKLG
jgi:hypothetical protein